MKLSSVKTTTKEIFLEGPDITVSVYPWGNSEGCSFLVHGSGKEMPLRLAASLRWEELDTLLAALTVARSA